jgi:uncharacterized membrane protein
MTERVAQAKQPVSGKAAGPYGHPFHPILVTVPIGAWICSLVFDIASHVDDDPGFLTRGSEWLIAIGIIGAALAALFGLLDFVKIPKGTRAAKTALAHMTLNVVVLAAYLVNFFWRHGGYTAGHAVSAGQLILSIVALALLSASGYLGGELAYRYGVRVADERTQAEGY